MSTGNRNNRILFAILMVGIVVNLLWSFRLESYAGKKSKTDIFLENIENGQDRLVDLSEFHRSADNVLIVTKTGSGTIELRSFAAILRVGKGSTGEGVELGHADSGTIAVNKNEGVGIKAKKVKIHTVDEDGTIDMRSHASILRIGKGSIGEGVELGHADSGTLAITKDKGIGLKADNIQLHSIDKKGIIELRSHASVLRVGKGNIGEGIELGHTKGGTLAINEKDGLGLIADKITVKTDKKAGKIQLESPDSVLRIGKGQFGDGVELGVLEHGTLAINKEKGIGIRDKKKVEISSGGDLVISAEGDINIKSKTGVIRINGKKIFLNK